MFTCLNRLVLLLAVVALPALAAPQRPDEMSASLFSDAYKAYKAGNLSIAEELFREGLKLSPSDSAAHYFLAEIQRKQGRLDEAQQLYERSLKLDPDSRYAIAAQGALMDLQAEKEAARKKVEAKSLFAEGYDLLQAGRYEEARNKFGEGLKLDNNPKAKAYLDEAVLALTLGEAGSKAVPMLRKWGFSDQAIKELYRHPWAKKVRDVKSYEKLLVSARELVKLGDEWDAATTTYTYSLSQQAHGHYVQNILKQVKRDSGNIRSGDHIDYSILFVHAGLIGNTGRHQWLGESVINNLSIDGDPFDHKIGASYTIASKVSTPIMYQGNKESIENSKTETCTVTALSSIRIADEQVDVIDQECNSSDIRTGSPVLTPTPEERISTIHYKWLPRLGLRVVTRNESESSIKSVTVRIERQSTSTIESIDGLAVNCRLPGEANPPNLTPSAEKASSSFSLFGE